MLYKNTIDVLKECKKIMIDKDISQTDLSNKLGVTKGSISNLLKQDNITLDKLNMLCAAIDCRLEINIVSNEHDK